MDIDVIDATNVEEALTQFKAHDVDFVLSDINLDDKLDGYDFLKTLRSQGSKVPFYFTSGFSKAENWPKAKNLGADGYLQVPFDNDDLLEMLKV